MNSREIPARYPAPPMDRLVNVGRYLYDGQGRWVLTFSSRLDVDRITRAFKLSLDAEPVLGSRFVEHPWRPYWERLPHEKLISPLSIVETDKEDAIHAWLGAPLDPSRGIQVRACLFRGSTEKLGITVAHEVADAGGLLDYLSLVGSIYRELRTNPAYVPRRQAPRIGQGPVLRNVGLRRLLRGCFHFSYPAPGVDFPAEAPGVPAFACRRLGPEALVRIREYCRTHGVTVHEVIYAAFYRAQFQMFTPPPGAVLNIPIPIDLRRFLPAGSECGICNLFANFFGGAKNNSLDALAQDVRRLMALSRSTEPWLGQAVLLELMCLLPFAVFKQVARGIMDRQIASGKLFPYITNYGMVDPRRFDFGDAVISDLEVWAPVPHHRLPNFSIYTVGDTLGVSVATRDQPKGRKAERLLDAYLQQLPGQRSPDKNSGEGAA